jgi:hypothetical protein
VLDRFRARAAPKPANSNDAPGALEAQAEAEEREARSRAEELLRLTPVEQAELIRREPERFSGLLLAEMLIEDSRERAPDRPKEAVTSARLARLVLHHTPISGYAGELYVRALAYLANAIRVIGDLPRADQILGDARYFFRALGCGDRLLRAELDSLEASLRRGQDRPDLSVPLLLRALMVDRLEGRLRSATAVLVNLATVQERRGEFQAAFGSLQEGRSLLKDSPDPRLLLAVYANLVSSHCHAGNLDVAAEVSGETDALQLRYGDRAGRLRHEWTKTRIARRAGDLEEAARRLSSVRKRFAAEGFYYDAALAGLELAGIYSECHEANPAQELLAEVTPVFRDLELPSKVAEAEALTGRLARR